MGREQTLVGAQVLQFEGGEEVRVCKGEEEVVVGVCVDLDSIS